MRWSFVKSLFIFTLLACLPAANAGASIAPLPDDASYNGVSGSTAFYTLLGGATGPNTYGLIDLESRATTTLDLSAYSLHKTSLQVVSSSYGFAVANAPAEEATTLLTIDRTGRTTTLLTRPKARCMDILQLLDIDGAGAATVLIVGRRPVSGTRRCSFAGSSARLRRISPDGRVAPVWLPREFKWRIVRAQRTRLGQVDELAVEGRLATLSTLGGTRRGPRSKVVMADLKKHSILRTFTARGRWSRVRVALGENTEYNDFAVSVTTYPDSTRRVNPRSHIRRSVPPGTSVPQEIIYLPGEARIHLCGKLIAAEFDQYGANPARALLLSATSNTLFTFDAQPWPSLAPCSERFAIAQTFGAAPGRQAVDLAALAN